ncbi:MAG: asparagine synthase (glutamine-hydrolyzing), partial [Candidatus Methylomirabilis sp.]|nr:asparagine synthase (glutamine-hydrolyzing) [Deltaproteobacteria bacterium]
MCGIAGYWGTGDIRAMAAVIGHRGPDEEGFHAGGPVALASKRLSVIDVEGGRQPISNAAGTAWIVYNGEVFNFQELRKELSAKYAFRTATDTEVVLHAYEEWGEDCLSRLNGQFAFAIWDGRRLFLARDRLGEKPLYYAVHDGTFLFASEIKSLLARVPARPRIPADFAVFETCLGADTMFEGIYSLPPAHCMTYDGESVRARRWWDLEFAEPEGRSEDDYVEELRWLLEDSVRLRLISDVPLGLFLSGGLDSAVIAALAKPEVVFSCRFPLGEAYDEFHWAERIARHIGARQHVVTPTAEDFRSRIENIIWHLDQPIATASSIAEFMLAERAAEHVKVVLGGQGSDEIFGGYVRYLLMSAERDLGEAE